MAGALALLIFFNASAQNKPGALAGIKIAAAIKKLTLEEKVAIVYANGLFSSAGVKQLVIPDPICDEGPVGARE